MQANARFGELLGYSPEELVGSSFVEFTYPEELEESQALFDGLISGDYRAIRWSDGMCGKTALYCWGQSSVSLIRNTAGAPVELVLVLEDITDRKLNEEALRESENRAPRTCREPSATRLGVPA